MGTRVGKENPDRTVHSYDQTQPDLSNLTCVKRKLVWLSSSLPFLKIYAEFWLKAQKDKDSQALP